MKLMGYFLNFIEALRKQLENDQERWGDEWKIRPIEANDLWDHQVDRVYARIQYYYYRWRDYGEDFPWLKVVGNCFIGWVREKNPDTYMLGDDNDNSG